MPPHVCLETLPGSLRSAQLLYLALPLLNESRKKETRPGFFLKVVSHCPVALHVAGSLTVSAIY